MLHSKREGLLIGRVGYTGMEALNKEGISPGQEDLRVPTDHAFSRVAGAPLIGGNSVRLLRDATENYPAWLEAIASAKVRIFLESYIIHDDSEGQRFADALIEKARQGVKVYLIYDWVGAFPNLISRFWWRLEQAGVEIRCFNPPRISGPFAWLTRDHRKALVIDNTIAFVSGLCIGCKWAGDPSRGIEPWRDTGIEVRGPAVAQVAHAFARAWAHTGEALPPQVLEIDNGSTNKFEDNVHLRIIATEPETAGIYRLDQLIAAIARERLWVSDAYFTGNTVYIQALVAAARDEVDVRLLFPGSSDISVLSPLTRVGYRPLLEAGVRVFEWNGPMMHAKTAVADGQWGRIGSTNLNFASWTGNWELDVAIEDERFAEEMEEMFLEDLNRSTEIVLEDHKMIQRLQEGMSPPARQRRPNRTGRVVAGALSLSRAVDSAIANRRDFTLTEARALLIASLTLVGFSVLLWFFPKVFTIPAAIILAWISIALTARVLRLIRHKKPVDDPNDPANPKKETPAIDTSTSKGEHATK